MLIARGRDHVQPRQLPLVVLQITVGALSCHIARCIVKIVKLSGIGGQAGGLVGRGLSEAYDQIGSRL